MSSGSAEDLSEEPEWVFYKDRPDWKDVKPIPQDDGPHSVVAISYSEQFKDVYDYFRGILKLNEKSERALGLTKDALELNPANYTVWQYRREILKHLGKDLHEELAFTRHMIENMSKNYQVWHHRGVMVEWLEDPSQELLFTEHILSSDAKNYHAWQHRQWVVKTFKLFDKELQYVDKLLDEDVRNNSAWNHRYFVINNSTGFVGEVLDREIAYTIEKIKLATFNESPWNYVRGLLAHHEDGLGRNQVMRQFCDELYAAGNRSPHLLAFLVDAYEDRAETGCDDSQRLLQEAVKLCHALASEHDTIRREYWKHVAVTLAAQ
ncbi:protein farnesyltransferase/geranylgeranyltransferase type-1 subunit alpha [Bacillus rossius redtenbacheri]|uniref:protein farnesyltransferase/geranylgeranyltransferase type-1 subunit alpha n=1 Tax=Bacillus rossius redtenbacheri TaxID=93214 RepID=UPI002FDD6CBA